MRHKPAALKVQRSTLDQKLQSLKTFTSVERPKSGWIKAIRESLGMTTAQLAQRLGVAPAAVAKLEKNERLKTTTLKTLEKAAQALNCRLVYAVIPEGSLEGMVNRQTLKVAQKLVGRVAHSMTLEKQGVNRGEVDAQVLEISRELKDKMSSKMWDEK